MNAHDLLLLATQNERGEFNYEDISFEEQRRFVSDPSRLKALFCTRRAAKSYTGGIYLIKEALGNPGCNCLFIGLTRLSAHGIVWKDILKEIDQKYKIGIKFNETLLTATLPNGSVIYVAGADSDESEMNKLLGKKYRLCILDEASMFSVNMHQLVYGVLKPATADQRGTICLLGTSSNITRGLFYDITTRKEPGWSLHEWTAHDNPHVAKQWEEELEDIRLNRPLFMETALFKQWYQNKWVIDEDAKVYKYDRERNRAESLPPIVGSWAYILGCDLAHSPDSTAFVVDAYSSESPILYRVYARKHLKMDITDCAEEVRRLGRKFDFQVKVIDGANKMAVAELNNRHQLGFIPADKMGKVDFIDIMNAEFIQGKIKLLPDARKKWSPSDETIEEEYESLVWITDNGKVKEPRKEHPTIHNDLADAGLYSWRHAYQYLYAAPQKQPEPGSLESWEPAHLQKLAQEIKSKQDPYSIELQPFDEVFQADDDFI